MALQQQRTSVKLVIATVLLLLPHYGSSQSASVKDTPSPSPMFFCHELGPGYYLEWAECGIIVTLGFACLVLCVILICCCVWCCRHKRRRGRELVESGVQLKEITAKELETVPESKPEPPPDTEPSHSGVHPDEPQEKSAVGEYALCGHQEMDSMELDDPFYDTVATSTKPCQQQLKGQEDDAKSTDQKPVTPARLVAATEQEANTTLSGTPTKCAPAGEELTPEDLDPCYDVVDVDRTPQQSNAQSLPEYATVNKPKPAAPPVPPYTTESTSVAESGGTGVPVSESAPEEVHRYVNVNNPNADPSVMENEYDSIVCI